MPERGRYYRFRYYPVYLVEERATIYWVCYLSIVLFWSTISSYLGCPLGHYSLFLSRLYWGWRKLIRPKNVQSFPFCGKNYSDYSFGQFFVKSVSDSKSVIWRALVLFFLSPAKLFSVLRDCNLAMVGHSHTVWLLFLSYLVMTTYLSTRCNQGNLFFVALRMRYRRKTELIISEKLCCMEC